MNDVPLSIVQRARRQSRQQSILHLSFDQVVALPGRFAQNQPCASTHICWVSFNYVISETFKDQPKSVKGTASLMLRKTPAGDWKIQMIHGSLYQRVAGLTDGD